jgi:hypothetical protein
MMLSGEQVQIWLENPDPFVQVNEPITLEAYVQDLRAESAKGVANAYVDLGYSSSDIAISNLTILPVTPGPDYQTDASSNLTSKPSAIDNVGGADTDGTAPTAAAAKKLLFTVTLKASSPGSIQFTLEPSGDDTLPVALFDSTGSSTTVTADKIKFGDGTNSGISVDVSANPEVRLIGEETELLAELPPGELDTYLTGEDASIADGDSTHLASLTVTLTNPKDGNLEYLQADTTGTSIEATYDATTHILLLEGTVDGKDTVANFGTVLRTIQYHNGSSAPDLEDRAINFVANDGENNSLPSTTVVVLNSAPVFDTTGTLPLDAMSENDTANGGYLVADLLGNAVADDDFDSLYGIAVTGAESGHGVWQYSMDDGENWSDIGTVSATQALLLRSEDVIRFVPDGKNADSASITYRAWDQSGDTYGQEGETADVSSNGGRSPFSSAIETATLTIDGENDAPVLDNSGSPTLTTINEDQTTNDGTTVSAILGSSVTDVDTGAVQGIALTATSGSAYGKWQYTIDGGISWTDVGTVSATQALLLRPQDKLRYIPDGKHGETPTITYRAWDQTGDTLNQQGQKKEITATGDTSPFSQNEETATLTVSAVNDPPTLTVPGSQTIDEDTPLAFAGSKQISVADPDAGTGTMQLTITPLQGSINIDQQITGTLAEINQALSTLVFTPAANYSGLASLKIKIDDKGNTGGTTGATEEKTIAITVNNLNDAPVLTPSSTATVPGITEDQTTNSGISVATLVGSRITDPDPGASPGIAITSANHSHGKWQYTLNDGTNWWDVGTISSGKALLLRGQDKLRFVPDGKSADSATLTYRAWDQSGSTAGQQGVQYTVTSTGTNTAFSDATETATITVTGINDAPVLNTTSTVGFTGIGVTETNNAGNTVAQIVGTALTDNDSDTQLGIAITALSSGRGKWQFSTNAGSTWTDVGAVSSTSALALRLADKLRFVPSGTANDSGSITFRGWDQTGTTSGKQGQKVDASAYGSSNPFSASTRTASITVTGTNNAPTLNTSGNPSVTTIDQDATDTENTGTLVSSLISSAGVDLITDSDSGAKEGIAVTSVDNTNGRWQFSTNGTTFQNFSDTTGSVVSLGASARLLASDSATRIRFVPNAGFNGKLDAGITFRAWDQTNGGTNGGTADTATNGGSSPFSTATETASMVVGNVTLGGRVCIDLNNNGELDSSEVGLAHVRVKLTGTDKHGHQVTRTTTTDENGWFRFEHLAAGTYSISEDQPAGYADGRDWKNLNGTRTESAASDVFSNLTRTPNQEQTGYYFAELGMGAKFLSKRMLLPTAPQSGTSAWQTMLGQWRARAEVAAGHQDLADEIRSSLLTDAAAQLTAAGSASTLAAESASDDSTNDQLLAAAALDDTTDDDESLVDSALTDESSWVDPLLDESL